MRYFLYFRFSLKGILKYRDRGTFLHTRTLNKKHGERHVHHEGLDLQFDRAKI